MTLLADRRFTVENREDGVEINIPTKRWWYLIIICTFMAIVSVLAFALTLYNLLRSDEIGGFHPAMLLFTLPWVIGCGLMVRVLVWIFWGKEVVLLDKQEVVIIRTDPISSNTIARVITAEVKNFRLDKTDLWSTNVRNRKAFWGDGGGLVLFDYRGRTISFGIGLNEAEGQDLIRLIEATLGSPQT